MMRSNVFGLVEANIENVLTRNPTDFGAVLSLGTLRANGEGGQLFQVLDSKCLGSGSIDPVSEARNAWSASGWMPAWTA
jgi:hypothetical protein